MSPAATQYFDAPDDTNQRLQHSPQNLENDCSYELTHLEKMVAKSLRHLQQSCTQMQSIEQELRGFLNDYYAQVGGFFEELTQLRQQIAEYDRKIRQAGSKRRRMLATRSESEQVAEILREELPTVPLDMQQDAWENEMKSIYHRLVKLYHPDVAGQESYSTQVVQLINQAYEKRNLWAMREMEHSLVEHALAKYDTPASKMQRLRERYDAIADSITCAIERSNRIQRSEAWRLKQRASQDSYMIEMIIHRVKKQIESARLMLAHKRIEYKASIL